MTVKLFPDGFPPHLSEDGPDVRILRRLQPFPLVRRPKYDDARLALIVDTETTGLDTENDEIIEIGLRLFSFARNGSFLGLHVRLDMLAEASKPLSPEISRLTGLTDERLRGKRIKWERVSELFEDAHLIIAHNASFDRPIVERYLPLASEKWWACSIEDVDWLRRGYSSSKLEMLLTQNHLFVESHRAGDDAEALMAILVLEAYEPPIGIEPTALGDLLLSSRRSITRLWALDAPYESRNQLKSRGYRWSSGDNGSPKAWYRDVPDDLIRDEERWLHDEVMPGKRIGLTRINGFDRFSGRSIAVEAQKKLSGEDSSARLDPQPFLSG